MNKSGLTVFTNESTSGVAATRDLNMDSFTDPIHLHRRVGPLDGVIIQGLSVCKIQPAAINPDLDIRETSTRVGHDNAAVTRCEAPNPQRRAD